MQIGTAFENLNIRYLPKIDNAIGENPGNVVGSLLAGSRVEIVSTSKDEKWYQINAYPDLHKTKSIARVWVYAQYVNVDKPVSSSVSRIGLNVLNRHEEVALPAAKAGCRYFIILNNPGFASRLKNEYPDAVVMARRYWDKHVPSTEEFLNAMDGCRDSRLIYTGLNEADELSQDINGIRQRAHFDRVIADKIREISGARYAAGAFSMGTPDITDQAVCKVMREEYADYYNRGLFDFHGHYYSPNMAFGTVSRDLESTKIVNRVGKSGYEATWIGTATRAMNGSMTPIDAKWFETRWRYLFTDCGFDINSPSRIHCSETGVDEGGVGGFPAHNATNTDVDRWVNWFCDEQAMPVLGKQSPFVGGAVFQVGNREDWNGYNVQQYYDVFAKRWQAEQSMAASRPFQAETAAFERPETMPIVERTLGAREYKG